MTTDVVKLDSQHQLDQEIKHLLTTFSEKETEHTWQHFDDSLKRLTAIARGGAAERFEGFVNFIKVKMKPYIVNSLSTERTRLSGTAVEFIEELARQTGRDFQPLVDIYFLVILKLCARTNKVYITRAQHCLQTIITQSRSAFVIPRLVEAIMTSPSKSLRQCAAENIYLCVKEMDADELEPYVENLEESMRNGVLDQISAVRECFKKICECYTGKFPDRTSAFISTLSDIAKKYFNFTKRSAPSSPALSSAKRAQFRKIKAATALEGDGHSATVIFVNSGQPNSAMQNEFERNHGIMDGLSRGPSGSMMEAQMFSQGLPSAKSEPMLSSATQYNGNPSIMRMTASSSVDDLKQVSGNKHYEKMMGAIGALRSDSHNPTTTSTSATLNPGMIQPIKPNHSVATFPSSTHPQGGARRILNTAPARTTHIENTATSSRQPSSSSLGNPLRVRRATEVLKEVPPTPQIMSHSTINKQNIHQPNRMMRVIAPGPENLVSKDPQPPRPPSRTVIGKERIHEAISKTQQESVEDRQHLPEDRKTNGNTSIRPPSRSSKTDLNKSNTEVPKTVSRPSHHPHLEQHHPPERTGTQDSMTPQQIFQNHCDTVTQWLKTARAPEWSVRAKALAVLGEELSSVYKSMETNLSTKSGEGGDESGHRTLITKILDALLDGLADRNNLKIVTTVLVALCTAIGTSSAPSMISRPVVSQSSKSNVPKPVIDLHRMFIHHLEPLYLRLLALRETNQWRTNRTVLERIRQLVDTVTVRYTVRERLDALVGVLAEVAVFQKGSGADLRGTVLLEILNVFGVGKEVVGGEENGNDVEAKEWLGDEKNIRLLLIRLSPVAATPDPSTRTLVKTLLNVIHQLTPSQTFCDVVGALKSGEKGILKNLLDGLVAMDISGASAIELPQEVASTPQYSTEQPEIDQLDTASDQAEPMDIDEIIEARVPTPPNEVPCASTGLKNKESSTFTKIFTESNCDGTMIPQDIESDKVENMSIDETPLLTSSQQESTPPEPPQWSIDELLDPNNLTTILRLCASGPCVDKSMAVVKLDRILSLASEIHTDVWIQRASSVVDIVLIAMEDVLQQEGTNSNHLSKETVATRLLPCLSLLNTLVVHQLAHLKGNERDVIRALLNEKLSADRIPSNAASELVHRAAHFTLQTILNALSVSCAISTLLDEWKAQIEDDKENVGKYTIGTTTALKLLTSVLKRPITNKTNDTLLVLMQEEFAEPVLKLAVHSLDSTSTSIRKSAYDLITVMSARYTHRARKNSDVFSNALTKQLESCSLATRIVGIRILQQKNCFP